jgi:hypothetical protein
VLDPRQVELGATLPQGLRKIARLRQIDRGQLLERADRTGDELLRVWDEQRVVAAPRPLQIFGLHRLPVADLCLGVVEADDDRESVASPVCEVVLVEPQQPAARSRPLEVARTGLDLNAEDPPVGPSLGVGELNLGVDALIGRRQDAREPAEAGQLAGNGKNPGGLLLNIRRHRRGA